MFFIFLPCTKSQDCLLNGMAAAIKCFPHTVAVGKLYLTGRKSTYAVWVCTCVVSVCAFTKANIDVCVVN